MIDDEVVGHRRSPDVERVLGRVIAGDPFDVGGHEVDAERILGEAAPRVLHVMKVVRAEDVAADAPAFRVARCMVLLYYFLSQNYSATGLLRF